MANFEALVDGFLWKQAQTENDNPSKALAIGQGAGAAIGGGFLAANVAGIPLVPMLREMKRTRFQGDKIPRETRSLIGSFMKKHQTYPKIIHDPFAKGPMFIPKFLAGKMGIKPGVHSPSTLADPSIYLHELGHSADYKKFPKVKLLGRKILGVGGLAAGIGLAASDDPEKRKYAPAAIVAGATPTLYQEGKASLLALKHLGREKGTKGVLRGLKNLGPSYATYAALPAGAALGLAWLNRRRNKLQESSKQPGAEESKYGKS